MYFNDATSNDIGILADSEENVREEMTEITLDCGDMEEDETVVLHQLDFPFSFTFSRFFPSE